MMKFLAEASTRQVALLALVLFAISAVISAVVDGLLHGWRFGVATALLWGLIVGSLVVIAAVTVRQRP